MPELLPQDAVLHATDLNPKSIRWCKQSFKEIRFHQNSLAAELPYSEGSFDFIYRISIFTHISEVLHLAWKNELFRVLKPGGILLITTQGEAFMEKLTTEEQKKFNAGELVTRGGTEEGHRSYAAFHAVTFIKRLFGGANILVHEPGKKETNTYISQDVWVIQKQQ